MAINLYLHPDDQRQILPNPKPEPDRVIRYKIGEEPPIVPKRPTLQVNAIQERKKLLARRPGQCQATK